MHVLPQLRKLERKYRESLVVIGVHSAKFPNEGETENVRNALRRYEIEHPVVNDREFRLWQGYAVRAWPTLMFVDPTGKVIGRQEGELEYERLDTLLADMMAEFDRAGLLDRTALPFLLESDVQGSRPLSFPGKIEGDPGTGRLFIADSNHNRILITDLTGRTLEIIGSGEPGSADGPYETASFWHPQGMALEGTDLYVADAENHLIRRVDLSRRVVATVAGTGEQALYRHTGGDPLAKPLNSPYDVALHGGVLYIAMAGFHQIWALDLRTNRIAPHAGDGYEDIRDGPLDHARLAQPYGIATDGRLLYFADSETSAVRAAGIRDGARVETIVGTGLFDFGDKDGTGDGALLQHVQGLALGHGAVYLADTYNHKVKLLDPGTRAVRTLAGTGRAGHDDGPATVATFNEPAGIALVREKLYIADTNNHAVRVLDLAAMGVSTLELRGL